MAFKTFAIPLIWFIMVHVITVARIRKSVKINFVLYSSLMRSKQYRNNLKMEIFNLLF